VRDNVHAGRWRQWWTPLGRRYDVQQGSPDAGGDTSGITDMHPGEPADGLLEHTGAVRWLCQAVVDHLQVAHRRNLRQAGAADGTGSPYY
jgi:hypothetical protein